MILDLLAPPLCWACHAPAARGSALCRECRGSLRFLPPPTEALDEKSAHIDQDSSSPRPPEPPPGPPALSAWAAVAYEGPARDLVGALKFHGARAVAAEMAALIVANAPPELLDGALVPVPLHPARLRARGFNQAALIAHAIGERARLPVADVLRRSGPATRQVGRDRAARLRGPPGEIRATGRLPAGGLPAGAALLVDDVVTTGATFTACASALRADGGAHVAALAFARTSGR